MNNTPQHLWDTLKYYYENEIKKDKNIGFRFEKEQDFIDTYISLYNNIKTNYMKEKVDFLDRHKQAAILIESVIRNDLIYEINNKPDYVFIGLEQTALLLGLSYMLDRLNIFLDSINIKRLDKYIMPKAFSCPEKNYIDILSRDLYYQKKSYEKEKNDNIDREVTFVLNLSNILYLLEYSTLIQNEISIDDLLEK